MCRINTHTRTSPSFFSVHQKTQKQSNNKQLEYKNQVGIVLALKGSIEFVTYQGEGDEELELENVDGWAHSTRGYRMCR